MSHHDYLFPAVLNLLPPPPRSVFEIGTGDGLFLKECLARGYEVEGLDPHPESIALSLAHGKCHARSIQDDVSDLGKFDVIVSMEVVEHLTRPRMLAKNVRAMLKPEGVAIITTPYHGYLKNLALSITDSWDTHMNPFWDYGHIKLWSRKTLSKLFAEEGMREIGFHRVGRVGPLAKSMIAVFQLS